MQVEVEDCLAPKASLEHCLSGPPWTEQRKEP